MEEEKAIRQLAIQNIMTGFSNEAQVDGDLEDKLRKEIQQNTLAVLDNIIVPTVSTGGPTLACDTLIRSQIAMAKNGLSSDTINNYNKETDDILKIYNPLKSSHNISTNFEIDDIRRLQTNDQSTINNIEFKQYHERTSQVIENPSLPENTIKVPSVSESTESFTTPIPAKPEEAKPTDRKDLEGVNVSAIMAAEGLIQALSVGNYVVELGGGKNYELKGKEFSTAAILAGTSVAMGAGATAVEPARAVAPIAPAAGLLLPLGSIWGYTKIREWAVKFAESEPIQVILLNKDGKPLQAGLKGADGIIAGKAMTAGWLSDYINFNLPTRTNDNIYSALGISLSDAIDLRTCQTYSEKMAALDVIEKSGSLESFNVGIFPPSVFGPISVLEVLDGDTLKLVTNKIDNGSVKYELNNNSIRLWGIDAPETTHGQENETQSEVGGEECKIAMKRYIFGRNNGGEVKLVMNPLNPKDAYGRGLAIVFGPNSPHYNNLETWVREPNITLSEIFSKSLNMDLVKEFAEKGWVNNMYIGATSQEGIEIKLWMDKQGDSI
jgi:endonuclease YncB( thermonuclease family)